MLKKILGLILLIAIVAIGFTTDWYQQGYDFTLQTFSGEKQHKSIVTFYQWTNDKGEVVVSREKPTHTENYISFEASSDLMTTNNNVNQELVARSNQIQAEYQQQLNKPSTNKGGGNSRGAGVSAVSGTIFSAPAKVKHCTGLANQIAASKREGKSKSHTQELQNKHNKEC